MTEINNTHDVSDLILSYLNERGRPSRVPYASKFAARTLAKRFKTEESLVSVALQSLVENNEITIERTTNNLRTYRVK
jgi:DNA-binding MarR family transcriptional regulator